VMRLDQLRYYLHHSACPAQSSDIYVELNPIQSFRNPPAVKIIHHSQKPWLNGQRQERENKECLTNNEISKILTKAGR
jgi:hypothetical protein